MRAGIDRGSSGFIAMVNQSQWLTSLNNVSDWLTPEQAENKSKVSLRWQSFSISAHPLFMAVFPSVIGLETVGQEMTQTSGFSALDVYYNEAQTGQPTDFMENLWDMVATEDGLRPLCTEDTGEPLGITTGGGVADQVTHHTKIVPGGWK
jgi:hypothetical protein